MSTQAAPEVLRVQRMSVSYDGIEDRIAVDVSGNHDRLARLWFTQYGCNLMVRSTAAHVESYAAAQQAAANVAPVAADQLRHSALATHQLTARLTQRSVPAVQLPAGAAEHLVTGFAMPPVKGCIQLDFKCRPELTVRVQLQSAELFQWLGAVQRQYQRAGWPMQAWPDWIS